jgi:hypothetical protein
MVWLPAELTCVAGARSTGHSCPPTIGGCAAVRNGYFLASAYWRDKPRTYCDSRTAGCHLKCRAYSGARL